MVELTFRVEEAEPGVRRVVVELVGAAMEEFCEDFADGGIGPRGPPTDFKPDPTPFAKGYPGCFLFDMSVLQGGCRMTMNQGYCGAQRCFKVCFGQAAHRAPCEMTFCPCVGSQRMEGLYSQRKRKPIDPRSRRTAQLYKQYKLQPFFLSHTLSM